MKEDLWDHAWEFHFNKAGPFYLCVVLLSFSLHVKNSLSK